MGVVLDSSVVIAAERARENPSDLIRRVIAATGNQELALSAIGYTELVHGFYRGTFNTKRALSRQCLDDLTRTYFDSNAHCAYRAAQPIAAAKLDQKIHRLS